MHAVNVFNNRANNLKFKIQIMFSQVMRKGDRAVSSWNIERTRRTSSKRWKMLPSTRFSGTVRCQPSSPARICGTVRCRFAMSDVIALLGPGLVLVRY